MQAYFKRTTKRKQIVQYLILIYVEQILLGSGRDLFPSTFSSPSPIKKKKKIYVEPFDTLSEQIFN